VSATNQQTFRSAGNERAVKVVEASLMPQIWRSAGMARIAPDKKEVLVPLTMYTTQWCGFCKRLKAQLGRAGVEITEVDIERDQAAAEFVMSVNGGNQTVPTLLFSDGSSMVNPSAAQVQARLAELATPQASAAPQAN
jgi:mycoredoxin